MRHERTISLFINLLDSPADGAFRGKTLRTLGEVLAGINRGNRFIPYRDSKLTFLCSDSLTRTSKSVLFIHIKMSEKDISETINSLRFGRSISQDLDQQPVSFVVYSTVIVFSQHRKIGQRSCRIHIKEQ